MRVCMQGWIWRRANGDLRDRHAQHEGIQGKFSRFPIHVASQASYSAVRGTEFGSPPVRIALNQGQSAASPRIAPAI